MALKGDLPKEKGTGICLGDGDHDCLTNLRFADDVFLFASTKEQLQNMLCDSKHSTEKVGLKIHPGKTKILSSQSSNSRKEIETDNITVDRLTRGESTKYLGHMVTFQQQEMTDIKNRIRAAWATLYKYKQELTSKSYLLRHPLRSFDMVVTPTMNYASGTWTLSQEHERMIQSTQRKMLRLIMQTKRKYTEIEAEDWIEHMKRSTDEDMERMKTVKKPMLDPSTQKNDIETSDENRIVTRRKMGSESSWMETGTQHGIQNLPSCGKTKKKMGR